MHGGVKVFAELGDGGAVFEGVHQRLLDIRHQVSVGGTGDGEYLAVHRACQIVPLQGGLGQLALEVVDRLPELDAEGLNRISH